MTSSSHWVSDGFTRCVQLVTFSWVSAESWCMMDSGWVGGRSVVPRRSQPASGAAPSDLVWLNQSPRGSDYGLVVGPIGGRGGHFLALGVAFASLAGGTSADLPGHSGSLPEHKMEANVRAVPELYVRHL